MGGFSLKAVPLIVSRTATLRIFNDRQLMLGTDKVAEPGNSSARSAEIPELPFAVERDGVPIDMIVDMGFVGMGANKKGVFAFQKTGGEVIADLICFLRRYFSRLKRLAYLVNKHITFFFFSGKKFILPFCH